MRSYVLRAKPAVLAGFLLLAMPAFAADPEVDRLLASQCAQCHGTNGAAVGEMDSLAGKSFSDLYGDVREMKEDDDLDDIMHRQARGYSDDQLRRIAEYYSSLPKVDDD